MKPLKPLSHKKPAKDQREKLVLFKLVDLYLKTGEPIGSNTLKNYGLDALSSATLRNYFVKLEQAGYLKQQHTSGGRIPTPLAFQLYAEQAQEEETISPEVKEILTQKLQKEGKEVASYLQQAAEVLSELTECAVFLSAPRFDQDFILSLKLVQIDKDRCVCILMTDFGLIHTEILYPPIALEDDALLQIEAFLKAKVLSTLPPVLDPGLEDIAEGFYKEIMLRHIVDYTHFSAEDLYKTGFSKLLRHKDLSDPFTLAQCLAIFENEGELRKLLAKATHHEKPSSWIGDGLFSVLPDNLSCSVLAISYKINKSPVGAFALLGPIRMPYTELFGILKYASELITASLTRSLYKFKITYRSPNHSLQQSEYKFLDKQQR